MLTCSICDKNELFVYKENQQYLEETVTLYFEGYEVLLDFRKLKGRQKSPQHWQMAFLLLHKH